MKGRYPVIIIVNINKVRNTVSITVQCIVGITIKI